MRSLCTHHPHGYILLISLAAKMKRIVYQLNVKSAFQNRYLDEEVYIEQTLGYMVKGRGDKVLTVKNALYRLKQVSRVLNSPIDKYLQENEENGFARCLNVYGLYIKAHDNGDILIACLNNDDFTGNKQALY